MPMEGSLNRDLQYIFYGNEDKRSERKIMQDIKMNLVIGMISIVEILIGKPLFIIQLFFPAYILLNIFNLEIIPHRDNWI